MEMLVDSGADLDLQVKALLWGETMDWETVVSTSRQRHMLSAACAQCGLHWQFHRREEHIYSNSEYLYRQRYGSISLVRNMPNKYLGVGY